MITFKEALIKDMQTLINTNEFASIHVLGGQEVPLIIDDDELQKRKLEAAEGTYVGDLLILVEVTYLNRRPVEGQKLTLDGVHYFVISCSEKDGLYEIAIGVNGAW